MKKVLLTLGVICFSLIVVHISTAEIDFESAVGIWLFDEGKGGVAKDLSGQGNDGEVVKAPWVDGKFGKALDFDGKAGCVKTGQKLLEALEEFTILAWIQSTDDPPARTGLVGQNNAPEFGFITTNELSLWTPSAGLTNNPWKHKHGDGNWHHVGCVATQDYVHTYIDGEYAEQKGNGGITAQHLSTLTSGVRGLGSRRKLFPGSDGRSHDFPLGIGTRRYPRVNGQRVSKLFGS